MKRALLIVLAIILGIAALAGAGFVGFQMGVRHVIARPQKGEGEEFDRFIPFGAGNPHMPGFDKKGPRGFDEGFGPGSKHHRSRGFGFILPLIFLVKIVVLGGLIWLAYKLFKGNGWQLTLSRVESASQSANPVEAPAARRPRKVKS